jgi:ribosomal protein L11 methyltransferase
LERYIKPDQHVFDIGCGSGILSIAALKMGAQHVLAVDVDSAAITSTLENTALNNIDPQLIETGIGSVNEILSGKFEREQATLVLVNILATVILKLFEQGLGQTVSEGGTLLLSGILDYQEADILNAAQNAGFTRIDRRQQEDWISLAMVKHAEK